MTPPVSSKDVLADLPSSAHGETGALRWAVRRTSGPPVFSLRLWFYGGSRVETIPGLAQLTGRMLSEGSTRRDWQTLARDVEERGMSLQTVGSLEAHGIAIDGLADDWEEAISIAAELAFEPIFPKDRCDWLRAQASSELQSLWDQPEVRTAWGFQEQLYTPHPASRPTLGTPSGLERLGPSDCRSFHEAARGRGAVVVLTGDVEPASAARRLEAELGALGEGRRVASAPPEIVGGQARRIVETDAVDQVHLYLGHLTVPLISDDLEALRVAGVVLGAGSGLSGRIPTRVREQQGLAYTVQASTISGAGLDPGRFVVYCATSPETVERAEASIRDELAGFLETGPGSDEFEEARAYLLGREPFRRETARQWSDLLADSLFYDQPLWDLEWRRGRLERLDESAVAEAARRHLSVERLRASLGIGPPD